MAVDARDKPVLLFDGVCNLCSASVQFVVDHDPAGRFRFAPLQSETARELLETVGFEDYDFGTFVLVTGDQYYTKSDAALRVARELEQPWSWLWLFRVVPRWLRDWVYDLVAEYRYAVFGKKNQCLVPTAELHERFLETDPATDEEEEE
jgi:predicted DCC family thiol-disulfide oxidoreductase YuxK